MQMFIVLSFIDLVARPTFWKLDSTKDTYVKQSEEGGDASWKIRLQKYSSLEPGL